MQMETLVEDPNGATVVSQPTGDGGASSPGGSTGGGQDGSSSGTTRGSPPPVSVSAAVAAHVRANGTVVFTSPAQVKHVVASGASTTQAIAVPQPGGAVSIVHVSIPNQPVHVQSVIQPGPNQQSVIQAAGGAALQSLSKNVILLNKVTSQGSVIHSTDGDTGVHPVQLISAKPESDGETVTSIITADDESKKRREILARRPSYRKILNDLSSTETQGAVAGITGGSEAKDDTAGTDTSSQEDGGASNGANTITVAGAQYHTATGLLKVVPASAIQLAAATQDGGLQSLQTLTMTNAGTGATGAIVQYAQGQDGQFFVPVTLSAADLQAYQIRPSGTTTNQGFSQGVVMAPSSTGITTQQQITEVNYPKRELRLLKNREAAKECRRKKKEYIKCLENRVAVLENQNKALIEELKSLKELYCQNNE